MKSRVSQIFSILLAVSMIGTLAVASCSGNEAIDGYKTLTVQNYIANFSMEYRAYYNDVAGPRIVDSDLHKYTRVTILAPKKTETMGNPEPGGGGTVEMEYVPAYIKIIVADASKYPDRPAAVRINDSISNWGKWPNFKLLERFNISVSGVEAEFIAYEVDGFFVGPELKYCTQVSFDYNGLHWEIRAEADIDMAEMVRADFDHVIETFKILH